MARGILIDFRFCGNDLAKRANCMSRGIGGNIGEKCKDKFLKTAILGEFVVLYVLMARKLDALIVSYKETIMMENSIMCGRMTK